MKKRILSLLLVLLLLLTCFGCGGKKTLDPAKLTSELLSSTAFSEKLFDLASLGDLAYSISFTYGIDTADYTAATVYCATSHTDELAIFTAKDEAAAKRIETSTCTTTKNRCRTESRPASFCL